MKSPKPPLSTRWPHLAQFLNWLVRLRGSPEAIAGGVAVGTLVAFTPTVGLQSVIALGITSLVGANRPVSLVPTWLTNPLTIPPVYAFTYHVGSFFWPGPAPASVAKAMVEVTRELGSLDFLAFRQSLGLFIDLGWDVFAALWIGGVIVGGTAALIVYPLTLRLVVRLRSLRERRRKRPRRRRRSRAAR